MGILIIADDAANSLPDVAQKFEPLARDIALKHGSVTPLSYVPLDDVTWGYQSSDETSLLMRCQATDEPADKGAVSAFFGEFTIARQADEKLVGVLVSTGGFTANGLNSAQAFYDSIRRTDQGGNFFVYDADDVLNIAGGHRKILPVQDLTARVERATGAAPVSFDLVLTSGATCWLVELDDATPGCFLLLSPTGDLLGADAIGSLPMRRLFEARPQLSVDGVANERYSAKFGTAGVARQRPVQPPDGGLLERTESDRRTRQQADALVGAGRTRLCPERGDSICQEFERTALTFFDHIAPLRIAVPDAAPGTVDVPAGRAAAVIVAVRLAALYLASSWVHRTERKVVGTPGSFAQQLVRSANFTAEWMTEVPGLTEAAAGGILDLMDGQDQPPRGLFAELVGLSGHLAAAYGPFCAIYRTMLHQQLLPDEKPELSSTPRLESVWTDADSQQLRLAVNVPTPRIHRHVVANRTLLQLAVERVEDRLGRIGEFLPFTRMHLSTNNANFEQIECYFELESEHILKIFMGEELYARKDVWLRELLQNAIDATLLRKALLDEDDYRPTIDIIHNRNKAEVQVVDNGVGMSLYHVRKFFSKVGRSYYRSSELEDELRKNNRTFEPISRFGVGFLSAFMVAKSIEILTAHVSDEDRQGGLSIYIPAIMEDFYIRREDQVAAGTKVVLEFDKPLEGSLQALIDRYILRSRVDINVVDSGSRLVARANERLSIIPKIVDDTGWSRSFNMISADVVGDGYTAVIGVPIPRPGTTSGERRADSRWKDLPKTRFALAQAGIWVKDDNEFFGQRRGHGEAYHPYFNRLFGVIDFEPGTLRISVSRNEFVLDAAATKALKDELLAKTIAAIVAAVNADCAKIPKPKDRNEYLRAVLFGAVEDGEQYYYSNRKSTAQLWYSNSDVLTAAMARLYAEHFVLEQRSVEPLPDLTVDALLRARTPGQEIYYTLVADIDQDPLFKAWLSEQPAGTGVLFAKSRREASLLIRAFREREDDREVRELTRKQLQMAIHFDIVNSPLDKHLLACAGVVRFGEYKPSTALLVMPTSPQTVSKAIGLVNIRADTPEAPYVLVDINHWLPKFLIAAAELAETQHEIVGQIREVCQILVLNVALGGTVGVRREGLQALNNRLTRLYASIDSTGQATTLDAIRRRLMLTMPELIGSKR